MSDALRAELETRRKTAAPAAPVVSSNDLRTQLETLRKPAASTEPVPTEPAPTEDVDADEYDPNRGLAERVLRRHGAELISTPGMLGLPSLAGAGLDYLRGTVNTFEEAALTDTGRKLYEKAYAGAPDDPQANTPSALAARELLLRDPKAHIKPGIKWAMDWYEYGEQVADAQKSPEGNVPLDEELGSVGLSVATIIPSGGTSILAKAVGLPTRFMASTGMRTVSKLAELALPYSVGASKASIAANTAAETAMLEATRMLGDEQTILQTARDIVIEPEDDDLPGATAEEYAGTAGLVGGAALASMALGRRMKTPRPTNFTPTDAGTRTPLGELPTDENLKGAAYSNIIDRDDAIRQAAEQTLGTTRAQELDDTVRGMTGQSVNNLIGRAYKLGILGQEAEVRLKKPLDVITQQFSQMPKDMQRTFDGVYDALDELSQRNRGLQPSSALTNNELMNRVNQGMRLPEVRQMVDDVHDVMRKMTEYRYKRGTINRAQYGREMTRGYYKPHIRSETSKTPIEKGLRGLRKTFMPTRGEQHHIDVPTHEQRRVGGIAENMPMSQGFNRYIHTVLRETNDNHVRMEVLSSIAGKRVQGHDRQLVRRLGPKEKSSGNTITVREQGEDVRYDIGDKRLYHALQFSPRMTIPALNTMRKVYQMGTTGILNPLFAPMSALYDMTFAALGTRSDLVTGPVDAALKRMGTPDSVRKFLAGPTRVIDIPYTYMNGVMRHLLDRRVMMEAQRLAKIAAQTGSPLDQQAAEAAAETFMQTLYGNIHRYGRTGNVMADEMQDLDSINVTMRQKFVGKLADSPQFQWYMHINDSIRDGMQMGMYARNASETLAKRAQESADPSAAVRAGLSPKEQLRLAKQVREIAADPTKQSGWQPINIAVSTSPYANIILQSTVHLAHHMLTNRSAWSVGAFLTGAKMLNVMMMSEEQRKHYEQTMPVWKRVGFMPVVTGDKVEDLVMMPLGPELGGVTSVGADIAMGMIDSDNELQMMTTTDRIKMAVSDLLGFAVPPAITVPMSFMTPGKFQPVEALLTNRPLFREPDTHAGIEEFRGIGLNDGIVSDKLAAAFNNALGTTGRAFIETGEALLDHPTGALSSEAWKHAMDVSTYEYAGRQSVGTLFPDVVQRDARVTPLGDKAYEVDQALKHAATIFAGLDADYGQPMDVDIPHDPLQQLPRVLKSDEMKYQAELVNEYFYSYDHGETMKELGQLHEAYRRTKGNPDAKPAEVNTALNAINSDANDRYELLLDNYGKFETYMRMRSDDPQWTIGRFVRRAQKEVYSD